jgi:hypothetical protein
MEKIKKLSTIYKSGKAFIIKNFIKIVTLIFLYQLLLAVRNFPYINTLDNYSIYVMAILLLVIMIFFKSFFTASRLLKSAILAFVFSYPFLVFDMKRFSEALGFIAYILLIIAIIQRVLEDRKDLRSLYKK